MKQLRSNARIYVLGITLVGATVFFLNAAKFRPQNIPLFLLYLAAAVCTSWLNLRIPINLGGFPTGFLLVLLGIVELSLPEVLFIGCIATLLSELRQAKFKVKFGELIFTMGSVATSIAAAYNAYHLTPDHRLNPIFPAILLASSLVFFFHYAIASAILRDSNTPLKSFYRKRLYSLLPWFVAAGYMACMIDSTSRETGVPAAVVALPILFVIERGYRMYNDAREREQQHSDEMAAVHLRTIEALAVAIEAKDQTTEMHLRRVQVYALEIGKDLGFDQSQLQGLCTAALLHDVGKLAIPEHIISKPGKLTPEEFEKMKIHPIVGAEIVGRMKLPYPAVPIIRSHHEKWDGTGYPDGLAGEAIPIGARILAAVDFLDALASDRPYRRALGLQEAMEKVRAESGKCFDPKIVEVLGHRYAELDDIAQSTLQGQAPLSTGEKVERCIAPATGLQNLAVATRHGGEPNGDGFLEPIASARLEEQVLRELTTDLGSSLTLNETLALVTDRLRLIVPFDAIIFYVRRGDTLAPIHAGGEGSGMFSPTELPVGGGLSGWVAQNHKPIVNGNPSVELSYRNDSKLQCHLNSALAVPLEGQAGEIGVLTIYHSEPDLYNNEHLRVLQAVGQKVGIAIEQALRYRRAESSATTDYLTGLPNARSLFIELQRELSRAASENSDLSVVVCDLDSFKQINDRFGHAKGNEVLRAVANGLRSACRGGDYVARLGGDEFVLIMPGLKPEVFAQHADRFPRAVQRAGQHACGENLLSISMGLAAFPADGQDADTLLSEADRRMYETKKRKKAMLRGDSPEEPREAATPATSSLAS
ncbi:MAG TPA: diguanylate cyclase [Bryobacteraceae bacterium]|nr:diguanylate cyclase [Bryobacteraceae bacterium]